MSLLLYLFRKTLFAVTESSGKWFLIEEESLKAK